MTGAGGTRGVSSSGVSKQILAALLAIVALMSGAAAVAAGPTDPAFDDTTDSAAALVTGVLSPRRAPGLLAEAVGQVRLENGLLAVLRDERYADADAESCLVVERDGQSIFSYQPDRPVMPASTLKLVTGWAALTKFGLDHRFETVVRASAQPKGGVVDRLWIVGGGDPLLATAAYAEHFTNQPQAYTSMDALADAVRRAGVTEVRDRVYGDDSRFDSERYLPSWKDGYVTDNEVGPVSALTVNDNFTAWRPEDVATNDAAAHGAAVLEALLEERGVTIAGDAAAGRSPGGAVVLAKTESPPMTQIVAQMMRESDNLTAEVLVKALGQRFAKSGSWAAGLEVVRTTLQEAGYHVDDLRQLDGSGLERDNRVTCTLLLEVLDEDDLRDALAAAMPVAGESGTLRVRLTEPEVRGRVKAKTGAIDNVAGLVGYAEARSATLEFALVGNGLPRSAQRGREFADAVARVLVAHPAVPPIGDLEPRPPVPPPLVATPVEER